MTVERNYLVKIFFKEYLSTSPEDMEFDMQLLKIKENIASI